MKNLLPPLLTLSLIASASVNAANIRCEACSPSGMLELAEISGSGQHTVFSLSTGSIRSYYVDRVSSDRGEPDRGERPEFVWRATETPVSAEQLQEFDSLHAFYVSSGGDLKYAIEVPVRDLPLGPVDTNGMTAFDYAAEPSLRERFMRATAQYANSWASLRHSGSYWQVAGSLTAVSGSTIEVVVLFSEGSKIVFQVEVTNTMGQQLGRPTDANGNPIPSPGDEQGDFAGRYYFGSQLEIDRMNRHFGDIGWDTRFSNFPLKPFTRSYKCALDPRNLRNLVCRDDEEDR
jgi:hypothetical protein